MGPQAALNFNAEARAELFQLQQSMRQHYGEQRHQEIMLESKLAIFRAETCLSLPGKRPWYLTAAVMPTPTTNLTRGR